MTRPIKFRAWHIKDYRGPQNKMYYNVENAYDGFHDIPVDSFGGMLNNDEWIIMQYTGLKDKNGKEIYEGDIVQYNDNSQEPYTSVIEFERGEFTFSLTVEDCLEVIGNIYENPDLLEERK